MRSNSPLSAALVPPRAPAPRGLLPLFLLGPILIAFAPPFARAAEVGIITGSVSNTATGNLLEGAKIEVPQLGFSTLTDTAISSAHVGR